MTKYYNYLIVVFIALGTLALMRWNALIRYSSYADGSANDLIEEKEKHFKNLKQLTFSGENAEAYFSSDSKKLIFQSHDGEGKCDQIYTMDLKSGKIEMVSTGDGVTTCAFLSIQKTKKSFMQVRIIMLSNALLSQILAKGMFGSSMNHMIYLVLNLMGQVLSK